MQRREFIRLSMGAAAAGLSCSAWSSTTPGELVDVVPFVDEGGSPIGTLIEGSHRGRYVLDLATVTEDTLITPNDQFFVRTRYPDLFEHPGGRWKLAISGHVRAPKAIPVADLRGEIERMGTQLLECSGNTRFRKFGLLSSAEWSGIPLRAIIDRAHPTPRATRVLVSGIDEHSDFPSDKVKGASWVFSFDDLDRAGAYLATHMNGEPLPRDHGEPVRLIMPNWYGCSCIKWVNEITFVDDTAPSTSQMREYASRTHQDGEPQLACDYAPATMELSGMATRVEKWREDGELRYRVWGILWGGDRTTDAVKIRFRPGAPLVPLENYEHRENNSWTLWSHTWMPEVPGQYEIELQVDDPSIRTRRLDARRYVRKVDITEV